MLRRIATSLTNLLSIKTERSQPSEATKNIEPVVEVPEPQSETINEPESTPEIVDAPTDWGITRHRDRQSKRRRQQLDRGYEKISKTCRSTISYSKFHEICRMFGLDPVFVRSVWASEGKIARKSNRAFFPATIVIRTATREDNDNPEQQ